MIKPLIFISTLFITSTINAQNNQLPNGDFEQRILGWHGWGANVSDTVHSGKNAIQVINGIPKWSGAHQVMHLPDSIEIVELSGWMKTKNVTGGKESWEKARFTLEFVDKDEKTFGGYTEATGQIDGTTDWTFYRKKYPVHKGATHVKVIVALGNCTGEAYFDDLKCTYYSSSQVQSIANIKDSSGNLLTDKGFENDGLNWNLFGGSLSAVAHSGSNGVIVRNSKPSWSGADQTVVLPKNAAKATVGGWIKTDNVIQGKESWETARISIEFTNDQGALVDGYPPMTGSTIGTQDWKQYTMEYDVPKGSRFIKVQGALGNATGTAYFDDFSLFVYDKDGKRLDAGNITGPIDEGEWYPLEQGNTASGGHYVDWSSLLDAPAGKHGFLTVKNGNFSFTDGTPARFWGTNLVEKNCFASNAEIDSLVNRLAKMGCNLLRLHHMDAPWAEKNIFGKAKGTRALSAASMKQLDYLISRCKSKGIYIFLDLLVHREFTAEDSVAERPQENGAKQVGIFSRKLIDLQKEYATQLLSHVNEYTKKAYKDEPAIIGSEFINESTIFTHFSSNVISGSYDIELSGLWKKSQYKDKTLVKFAPDWQPAYTALKSSQTGDIHESLSFLSSLEMAYFKEMEKHLRSIGVKYPLSGSNMPMPFLASLKDNATMDFTISNEYWDHPQIWKIGDDWSKILYAPLNNGSQLKSPNRNIIFTKSYYKVDKKPFIITEWNHCYPNEHIIEAVPLVAAYSSLQGWDGALQFDFDLQTTGKDRIKNFTLSVAPEQVALWVMGAPLFLRGDVKTAPGIVIENITDSIALSLPNYSEFIDRNHYLPFVTRVAKTFNGKASGKPESFKKYFDENSSTITSETNELSLNSKKGVLKINTPRVQGVSGFIADEQFDFPAFTCKLSNTNASVFAVSKSDISLEKSSSFYIVVVGPVKMTNQKFNPTRSALENPGTLPVLAQIIKGSITFTATPGSKVTATPLTAAGVKCNPISLSGDASGKFIFNTETGRTLVYEINIAN